MRKLLLVLDSCQLLTEPKLVQVQVYHQDAVLSLLAELASVTLLSSCAFTIPPAFDQSVTTSCMPPAPIVLLSRMLSEAAADRGID